MKEKKDWTGNKKSTFVTLGASNHTDHSRAWLDFMQLLQQLLPDY